MNNNYKTNVDLLQKLNEEDSSSSDSDLSEDFDPRLDEEFNVLIKKRKKKPLEQHSSSSKEETPELQMARNVTNQLFANFAGNSSSSDSCLSEDFDPRLDEEFNALIKKRKKKTLEQNSIGSKEESAELPMATNAMKVPSKIIPTIVTDDSTPIGNESFVASRNEKRTSRSPSFFQWDKF